MTSQQELNKVNNELIEALEDQIKTLKYMAILKDLSLIKKINELENTLEYTTKDDFFGRGWDHAKKEIIKLVK